jgi:hypothetical protein
MSFSITFNIGLKRIWGRLDFLDANSKISCYKLLKGLSKMHEVIFILFESELYLVSK